MSIYSFNVNRASEELMPPELRLPRQLAWLRVFLSPIRRLADLFTRDYLEGANESAYDNGTPYTFGKRVVWTDGAIYEVIVSSVTGVRPHGDTDSASSWLRVLNNHIGADERVLWNNQIIVFEYALNRWFRNSAPADQIYLTVHSPWVSGSFAFTVNVPVALFTSLGTDATSRENTIRQFVDRYNNPAYNYLVASY